MTLPSSGAISFDNLRTERAVGGAINLGDTYRQGSKTPVYYEWFYYVRRY